jgi:DNA-3-methyladenine glycosylase II
LRGREQSSDAVALGTDRQAEAVAIEHLRASDPVLRAVIDQVGGDGLPDWRGRRQPDHYGALVRSIVGQQLSTRSARAIYGRLLDRFGGRPPTPAEVLADDPDELRTSAGLSHAKVVYLRSLAEHVIDGSLNLDRLDEQPDDEVTSQLTAIRGIGPWSAHLFLMFQLGRPDVLAVGDLGIRRAVMVRYGLPALPGPAELEAIAEPWRPYRTLACRFLWRSIAATPVGG